MIRPLVSLTMIALGAVVLAPPAQADAPRISAIGDSYIAGIGAGDYTTVDGCRRSSMSYAADLARRESAVLSDLSCPGARAPEALLQAAGIPADSALVLIQIGGNDIGFSRLALACATGGSCSDAIAGAARDLTGLPDRIAGIVDETRARAPQSRVIVMGYPALLSTQRECRSSLASGWIDRADMAGIIRLQRLLDDAIRTGAETSDAEFIDWPRVVDRHSLCSADPWFALPWTSRPDDSLHPTSPAAERMGQRLSLALRR